MHIDVVKIVVAQEKTLPQRSKREIRVCKEKKGYFRSGVPSGEEGFEGRRGR